MRTPFSDRLCLFDFVKTIEPFELGDRGDDLVSEIVVLEYPQELKFRFVSKLLQTFSYAGEGWLAFRLRTDTRSTYKAFRCTLKLSSSSSLASAISEAHWRQVFAC